MPDMIKHKGKPYSEDVRTRDNTMKRLVEMLEELTFSWSSSPVRGQCAS